MVLWCYTIEPYRISTATKTNEKLCSVFLGKDWYSERTRAKNLNSTTDRNVQTHTIAATTLAINKNQSETHNNGIRNRMRSSSLQYSCCLSKRGICIQYTESTENKLRITEDNSLINIDGGWGGVNGKTRKTLNNRVK